MSSSFTVIRNRNIVFDILCWLFFNCEDNDNYDTGKMVHLTGVLSSKGSQSTLSTTARK